MKKSMWLGSGTTFAALVVMIVLTGCVSTSPAGSSTPVTTSTAGSDQLMTPSTSAIPTATSTPAKGQPIGLTCSELMSVQDLYQFNANFSFNSSVVPAPGSLDEKIVQEQGISCGYVNLSSGENIVLSVAKLSPSEISDQVTETKKTSAPTDAYASFATNGAFFVSQGGAGNITLFSNTYWISVTSTWFAQPEDALKFLDAPLMKLS